MATRPSVEPDWAENNVVDPTSGENNKVEPPSAWKLNGWSYQEKPPRNYDNYVKWNLGQWIKYLDEIGVRPATYFVAASDAAAETKLHADAVCDGTDDHTDINTAITSVSSTGGKVLLSEGTFTIAGEISMASNVHLQGMGPGATIVKVKDSDTGVYTILDIDTLGSVTVSDLTIDGNSASASSNNTGVVITSSTDVALLNLAIKNISRNTAAGDGISTTGSQRVRILNCTVRDCQYRGIVATSGTIHVADCLITGTADTGILFDSSSTNCSVVGTSVWTTSNNGISAAGSDQRIIGCEVLSCDQYGIALDGQAIVKGCIVKNNDQHGFYLAGGADECIIEACIVDTNGQGTHDTYSGFYFASGASNNTITNCRVRKGASSPQQKYGMDLSALTAGTESNYIYGNDMLNSGASAIWNTGAAGSSKTIPEYVGSSTSANVQDNIGYGNRTT